MNTLRYHLELRTVFLSMTAAAVSLSLVITMKGYRPQSRVVSALPITVDVPTPVKTFESKVTVTSQTSSDGTKKLFMKTTGNKNGTKTYTFSTADGSGTNEQIIFSKTLETKKSLTIPFNAWSPDNKYFFIRELDEEENNFMAFKATGEQFASQEAYLDLTNLFKLRVTKNNFSEATGWASETLIIINTTTPDNTKGPSYWFEIPSRAIIQLGTQF